MLKRIYIDNFRSLVNFELSVGPINLFLGPNGSGKSTTFQVLAKIQLLIGGEKAPFLFPPGDLTRWQRSNTQSFEIEITGNDGIYKYELAIEHFEEKSRTRIKYERLWFDSKPLLQFVEGEAQLYRDNHSEGPKFPFDWERSVLATIPARRDNTRLTWFRERLRRFLIVQVNPTLMISESTGEEPDPSPYLENFASWYRYIYQDQAKAFLITQALKEIWERFDNFKFAIAGEQHRILMLSFSGNGDRSKSIEYRFDELSDGERTLVALYTLLYAADSGDYTLLIDEPENFVALPEIQPWLVTLYDLCNEGKLQALLISHHPELIDYLASSAGYWFERQGNTPVRVKRITDSIETGLPVSELVARGWIHA